MESKALVYALGVWALFIVIATIIGSFMSSFVAPFAGSYAYFSYILILLAALLILTYIFIKESDIVFMHQDLLGIGAFWVILTLVYDLIVGIPWSGNPWVHVLSPPAIPFGDLWLVLLLTQLMAPLVIGAIHKW